MVTAGDSEIAVCAGCNVDPSLAWSPIWGVWLCTSCRFTATEQELAGKPISVAGIGRRVPAETAPALPLAGVPARIPSGPLPAETGILL